MDILSSVFAQLKWNLPTKPTSRSGPTFLVWSYFIVECLWFFTLKKGLFPKNLFSTNGNYVLETFVTSVSEKRWVQRIYQPSINFLTKFFPWKWLVHKEILNKTFSGFYFFFSTVFCHFPVLVQILSFAEKLLLFIGHLFNKTDPKRCLKTKVQERLWESGFITSPNDNSNSRLAWKYRSRPQDVLFQLFLVVSG